MQQLVAGPRAGLAADVVTSALAAAHSTLVRHGVDVLDDNDTPTGETILIDAGAGGQVTWSYRVPDRVAGAETSAAAVRRTARITIGGPFTLDLAVRRFLIWTELRAPSGDWVRFDLGVFVATLPTVVDDGRLVRRTLDLADKTHLYASLPVTDPIVVDADTVVTTYIRTGTHGLGPVFDETRFAIVPSTRTLDDDFVFESGSYLDFYNALLATIGHDQLIADETGIPTAHPLADLSAKGIEHTYGDRSADRTYGPIVVSGQLEPLLPTIPNVVRFVARAGPSLPEEGNGIATRTNQSTGPASVDARGREVLLRVDVDAEDQAALDDVADADAQRYFAGGGYRFSGHVGLNPRHSDRDVIGLVMPRLALEAGQAWQVTEWSYPISQISGEQAVLMPLKAELRVSL